MSDFGKKLLGLGVAAGLLFLLMAFITWCNVNQYDEGEFVMNIAQTAAGVASMVFLAQLKAFFGLLVLLALALGSASEAQAGPFGLFGRQQSSACANGACAVPVAPRAAVAPAPVEAPHAAVAARPNTDRESRIVARFDGSRLAVMKKLRSDDKLRERFAEEWNRRYREKVSAADWASILEVILKYLPQVLEIILALLKS